MPTPEQLSRLVAHDEIADLLARFDDAVIRDDQAAFGTLWTNDAIWEIGPPIPMRATGLPAILAALETFHTMNEFFFRMTARPVIRIDGDRATLRSPTIELARREGQARYSNVAIYQDDVRYEAGEWRFARRTYQYLWVDRQSPLPGEIAPPSSQD